MDLNDWLRGERDWRDFWDLKEQLPTGSHYRAAILKDPMVVEVLARQEDSKGGHPPVEDWDGVQSQLSTANDLLLKILYATAQQNPSEAPETPKPVYPHLQRRREMKAEKRRRLEMVLVPHEFGDEGGDDA